MTTLDTAPPGAATEHRTRRSRPRLWGFVQRWTVFAICVLIWQFTAAGAHSAFFPTPAQIADTARQLWLSGPPSHLFLGSGVFVDVLPSIGKVLGGFALSALIGIVFGVAIGLSRVITEYTGVVLAFVRALPPVMAVPVFLQVFHLGVQMQMATILSGAVWPVLLNTIDGVRAVDATKMDTARVFRISRARLIATVVFPAALPRIFGGLRISLAIALILMVIAEMTGGVTGLGYEILQNQSVFAYQPMWAGIVLVSALGYLFNRLLQLAERRALRWHRESMRLTED